VRVYGGLQHATNARANHDTQNSLGHERYRIGAQHRIGAQLWDRRAKGCTKMQGAQAHKKLRHGHDAGTAHVVHIWSTARARQVYSKENGD